MHLVPPPGVVLERHRQGRVDQPGERRRVGVQREPRPARRFEGLVEDHRIPLRRVGLDRVGDLGPVALVLGEGRALVDVAGHGCGEHGDEADDRDPAAGGQREHEPDEECDGGSRERQVADRVHRAREIAGQQEQHRDERPRRRDDEQARQPGLAGREDAGRPEGRRPPARRADAHPRSLRACGRAPAAGRAPRRPTPTAMRPQARIATAMFPNHWSTPRVWAFTASARLQVGDLLAFAERPVDERARGDHRGAAPPLPRRAVRARIA